MCRDTKQWKPISKFDVPRDLGQQKIVVREGYAYHISGKTMRILDVSDSGSVETVGIYSGDIDLDNIALSDHFAIVTSLDAGLIIIDIRNIEKPELHAIYPESRDSRFHDILIKDDYAFVADFSEVSIGEQKLTILDISEPTIIREIAQIPNGGKPLAIQDNYVYAKGEHLEDTSSVDWLNIIDISDIRKPKLVLHTNSFGAVLDADIQNNYLYIATDEGLVISDISNPVTPIELSRENVVARQFFIQDSFVYYMGFQRVGMIDVLKVNNPKLVGISREIRYATDIAYGDGYVYFVGDSFGMLYIFEGGTR